MVTAANKIKTAAAARPKPNDHQGWAASRPPQRRARDRRSLKFAAVRHLSERQDLREAAANLFRYLRELDVLGLDLIVAERVPSQGLGAAILDRLQRAAHELSDGQDTPE